MQTQPLPLRACLRLTHVSVPLLTYECDSGATWRRHQGRPHTSASQVQYVFWPLLASLASRLWLLPASSPKDGWDMLRNMLPWALSGHKGQRSSHVGPPHCCLKSRYSYSRLEGGSEECSVSKCNKKMIMKKKNAQNSLYMNLYTFFTLIYI
jgi:hypothetical protein